MIPPPPPPANTMLVEANRLFSNGNYAAAGNLYEQLARTAMSHDGPRAPHFWMQAGKAFFLAMDSLRGMQDAQQGLLLLSQQQRYADMERVGDHTIQWLKDNGHAAEAEQIKSWLAQNSQIRSFSMQKTQGKPDLPGTCPNCGAPLHEIDVTWQENGSAVCNYCSAVLEQEE
jgi:hypothetical protein